jgi:hypothetical protein
VGSSRWPGRIGFGVEGAARREVLHETTRSLAAAGSVRLLLADWMWPSLLEPRDVEMGVELQLIGERTWWDRETSLDSYGIGVALRMRGGSDWDQSPLLAESRLFVRVMRAREPDMTILARDASSPVVEASGTTVMIGLGAAWGAGKSGYLDRFRQHEPAWLH